LPVVKSKPAAKSRLLAAMGTGKTPTLKVPEKISNLEKEMKQEYDRLDLAARKEYYELKEKEAREEKKKISLALQRRRTDLGDTTEDKKGKSKARSTIKRKDNPSDDAGPSG